MKKNAITAMILATTMMLALMGCGASSTNTDSSSSAASVAEDTKDKDNTDTKSKASVDPATIAESSIEYKGETFSPFEDLQASLDKADSVGKRSSDSPIQIGEGSCNYSYEYDVIDAQNSESGLSFSTTDDDNGKQIIMQVTSFDPNAKTTKGIHPGSTKDELFAAYGEQKPDELGFYSYDFETYGLLFKVSNDKVIMIASETMNYLD